MASARTLFLWYVSVAMVAGLRMSHSRMVLSCEPVITCAHAGLHVLGGAAACRVYMRF